MTTRTLVFMFAFMLGAEAAFAADHLDGPAVSNDPAADINDVYAFVNPNDSQEIILVATVVPLANEQSRFSNVVTYQFSLQGAAAESPLQAVSCRFPGSAVICNGPGGSRAAGPVGRNNGSDGLRVFAGLRDDPFYFDLVAFQETVATLTPQFTNPGEDFFEGLNTLAIVIGIDRNLIDPTGDNPVQKVYALTRRGNSPGWSHSGYQVDRMGRPGVNTALIDLLASTGLKDQYNQAEAISSWPGLFQAEIEANISALDTLDGVAGNTLLPPAILAAVLVDDRLVIDMSQPFCDAYLAVELGLEQCGGRTLERDVIDDTFGALVGPGVTDFVDDTNHFLAEFPFLGAPGS
jgi:hypothetical protein